MPEVGTGDLGAAGQRFSGEISSARQEAAAEDARIQSYVKDCTEHRESHSGGLFGTHTTEIIFHENPYWR